jgi:exosortase/archaeosortase family protein
VTHMSKKKDSEKNGDNNCPRFHWLAFILFPAVVLTFHIPFWIFPYSLMPFQKFMVKLVAWLIDSTGLQVARDGIYIHLENQQWIMTPECTAITAIIVFVSFVLLYPASLKAKSIGILTGVPFLVGMNILRLVTLAWVTQLFVEYAPLFHDYVWQVVFLILMAIMWLIWIDLVVKRESEATVSH